MKQEVALRVLRRIMNWDEQTTTNEFKALSILSTFKYDSYADYIAGARFLERLARWLQQFDFPDRRVMYDFVRRRLLFITAAELERLIEAFFARFVYYDVLEDVAHALGCAIFEAISEEEGRDLFEREVRRTLFVGMSDGARLDVLRRYNVGKIKNDQFLLSVDADDQRWESIYGDLCKDLECITPFRRIYLIDDFVASGTTFLKDVSKRKGKIFRFQERFKEAKSKGYVDDETVVTVHHFLSTHDADAKLRWKFSEANSAFDPSDWFPNPVAARASYVLSEQIKLHSPEDDAVIAICNKYYDPAIEKPEHGQVDMQLGYLSCALPLVLQHNTPNNSIALLWKEHSPGQPPMRALFHRRERH